jgi:hypothetical protein
VEEWTEPERVADWFGDHAWELATVVLVDRVAVRLAGA